MILRSRLWAPPFHPRSFENSLGYISLAISAYMDRDTVALPGCAKFFRVGGFSCVVVVVLGVGRGAAAPSSFG